MMDEKILEQLEKLNLIMGNIDCNLEQRVIGPENILRMREGIENMDTRIKNIEELVNEIYFYIKNK